MPLQHRREMDDMRSAYTFDEPERVTTPSKPVVQHSDPHRVPPPPYPLGTERRAVLPNQIHYDDEPQQYFNDRDFQESPRSSQETYASTVHSMEELEDDAPEYNVPELISRECTDRSNVIESTPKEFSNLFPSSRRLTIHHDDTTMDGNMNLRVDTGVSLHGVDCDMTLFHLRMHDLKTREFSLRRHCRNSGREVCHSLQKIQSPKRPGFQRSLSNALHSIRPKSEHRGSITTPSLTRHDSGYGSMHSMDFDDEQRPPSAGKDATAPENPSSNNTIKLEFSNYAQVEVRRAGNSNTRYEFEYWGVHYCWKRVSRSSQGAKEVSFHLKRVGSESPLAFIDPVLMTPRQKQEERRKGGWVKPSSMRITDDSILHSQKDVADVVLAAGLIALVDDSIRARFLSKTEKQLLIPIPKVHLEMQHVGAKQLINDMFNRKEHHGHRHSSSDSNHQHHSATDRPRTAPSETTSERRRTRNTR